MRSSRGGLGAIPSQDKAGAPKASPRSHQANALELVAGRKSRPSRQRVIAAGPCLTSRDLTPNARARHPDRCLCKLGIDGAIYISPFSMYRYDGSYAVEVQRAHPGRFALVKPVDPDDPAVAD